MNNIILDIKNSLTDNLIIYNEKVLIKTIKEFNIKNFRIEKDILILITENNLEKKYKLLSGYNKNIFITK